MADSTSGDGSAVPSADPTKAGAASPDEPLDAATLRDAMAHARDLSALARDQAAALRDRRPAADEPTWAPQAVAAARLLRRAVIKAEILRRAAEDQDFADEYRTAATEARARAAADRRQAARDRERAAHERARLEAERDRLRRELTFAGTDTLTGARTRGPGLADLEREIDRTRRDGASLVVAYVDVVGLKAVNDSRGHAAGDAMLQRVVGTIRARLRSYDTIVRLGGDEFLCLMPGATGEEAGRRFAAVGEALRAHPEQSAITAGFAMLRPQDTAAELVDRADREMLSARKAVEPTAGLGLDPPSTVDDSAS